MDNAYNDEEHDGRKDKGRDVGNNNDTDSTDSNTARTARAVTASSGGKKAAAAAVTAAAAAVPGTFQETNFLQLVK